MMHLKRFALALLIAAIAAPASHAQYTQTLPEFSGASGTYPSSPFSVGTFTGIPAGTVTVATISGTFGNSVAGSSAPARVYLNSILVAQCQVTDSCYSVASPWSYVFSPSQFASLSGPTADLTVVQDGCCSIRLGETTLDIRYDTVATPEPATLGLLTIGLAGILGVARRKKFGRSA